MARQQRNLVDRLADAGEEAIQRLGNAPGGERVLGVVNSMRDRVDEMQKRVRGLEDVEKRLRAVERRLDKLEGKGATRTRKSSAPTTATPKSGQTPKTES
jgi:hypothetical protein